MHLLNRKTVIKIAGLSGEGKTPRQICKKLRLDLDDKNVVKSIYSIYKKYKPQKSKIPKPEDGWIKL